MAIPDMHAIQLLVAVIAVAFSACSVDSEFLNSERIQERFGSYEIEVLANEPQLRRSNLYSVENGVPVCRTYAVVQFAEQFDGEISKEHAEIKAGGSIGATFKASGWRIQKQTLHVGSIRSEISARGINRLMHLDRA